ncbi:MAG TPA: hypothetical protein EYQ60_13045 [Myxococcales bacterium]|nr:hypothetical protein [Myxococcales bacterium]HIK83681.1 hypothetical protein [Myxococcales bacterium]
MSLRVAFGLRRGIPVTIGSIKDPDLHRVVLVEEAGAEDYLLKDSTSTEIADSLDELISGGSPMSARPLAIC